MPAPTFIQDSPCMFSCTANRVSYHRKVCHSQLSLILLSWDMAVNSGLLTLGFAHCQSIFGALYIPPASLVQMFLEISCHILVFFLYPPLLLFVVILTFMLFFGFRTSDCGRFLLSNTLYKFS